jgi:hypothetical protein
MLRRVTLPGGLSRVLEVLRPCVTAPTFETFTVLVAGLFAAPVGRTVCGMLTGAGLAQVWHHARAHPRNHGSPASLGTSRRISAKAEIKLGYVALSPYPGFGVVHSVTRPFVCG